MTNVFLFIFYFLFRPHTRKRALINFGNQCPPEEKHLLYFTHIGHEHSQCSLKET